MRGKPQAQPDFLTVVNLNACVPAAHPLRAIKTRVDACLRNSRRSSTISYAADGAPSIPPEQLLKARVLTALYSGRSERLFCEQPVTICSGSGSSTANSAKGASITASSQRITSASSRPFTVQTIGPGPLGYQWYHGDTPLPDENAPTLTLANIGLADAGEYRVLVSNDCGTRPSHSANLTMDAKLQILTSANTTTLVWSPALDLVLESLAVASGGTGKLDHSHPLAE